jgi:general secretion pathway protein L
LKEFDIKKARVALSIPKVWAVYKTAEFPATVRENLADVIRYELDRITPLSADETVYDFRVLSESNDRVSVLVAAANKKTVDPYLEAIRKKGLDVIGVTVNLSSVGTLAAFVTGNRDFACLSIQGDSYEAAVFMGGSMERVVAGSAPQAEEEAFSRILMKDMEHLIDILKESGKPAQVILFSDRDVSQLRGMIEARADIAVISGDAVLRGQKLLKTLPAGQAPAAGALIESLWPKAQGMDLLLRGVHIADKTPLLPTALLCVTLIGMAVGYMIAPLGIEQRRLDEITRQINATKDGVRKVEALKKEVDALSTEIQAIGTFKEKRPPTLNMVTEMTSLLPNNAWLTRLRVGETSVDIEGYAASATEILPKLETSKYFSKVALAATTFRDQKMNADRFTVKMEIEGLTKDEKQGTPKSEKK